MEDDLEGLSGTEPDGPLGSDAPRSRDNVEKLLYYGVAFAIVAVLLLTAFIVREVFASRTRQPRTYAEQLLADGRARVEAAPEDPTAHTALAAAYVESGDYRRATDEYREAAELAKGAEKLAALYGLATAYRLSGATARSVDTLKQLLAQGPVPPGIAQESRYWLGLQLADTGDLKGAATELETLLKAVPSDAQAIKVLAGIYERTDRAEDAIRLYERVLSFQPGDADAKGALERLGSTESSGGAK